MEAEQLETSHPPRLVDRPHERRFDEIDECRVAGGGHPSPPCSGRLALICAAGQLRQAHPR